MFIICKMQLKCKRRNSGTKLGLECAYRAVVLLFEMARSSSIVLMTLSMLHFSLNKQNKIGIQQQGQALFHVPDISIAKF